MGKEGVKTVLLCAFCVFVWVIVLVVSRSSTISKVKGLFIEASGVIFSSVCSPWSLRFLVFSSQQWVKVKPLRETACMIALVDS